MKNYKNNILSKEEYKKLKQSKKNKRKNKK